jgi:hypothetical protein
MSFPSSCSRSRKKNQRYWCVSDKFLRLSSCLYNDTRYITLEIYIDFALKLFLHQHRTNLIKTEINRSNFCAVVFNSVEFLVCMRFQYCTREKCPINFAQKAIKFIELHVGNGNQSRHNSLQFTLRVSDENLCETFGSICVYIMCVCIFHHFSRALLYHFS